MSSLFDRMAVDCTMRVYSDGWSDGEAFKAAIVKNSSFEARIAERDTGRASYTITTQRELPYHAVFKRDSDDAVFRVTGGTADSSPPSAATFDFKQAQAELWEEPDDE